MKKIQIIAGILMGLSLLAPSFAFARSMPYGTGTIDCDSGIATDNLGATSTVSTIVCNGGGAPTGILTEAWGWSGSQTPVVAPGVTITDERGLRYLCPIWYPISGCYDITGSPWYRLAMGYTK